MRAAALPFCVGVMTFIRTYRPLVFTVCVLTSAVLPRTCATVVKLVPLAETCRSKSRVSNAALSPPAPACRTVNEVIDCVEPRSTCRYFVPVTCVQNLSVLPPDTEPLTALAGVSLALQGAEPVAGLFRARFSDGGGCDPTGVIARLSNCTLCQPRSTRPTARPAGPAVNWLSLPDPTVA